MCIAVGWSPHNTSQMPGTHEVTVQPCVGHCTMHAYGSGPQSTVQLGHARQSTTHDCTVTSCVPGICDVLCGDQPTAMHTGSVATCP